MKKKKKIEIELAKQGTLGGKGRLSPILGDA